jgi:hypothetical protein
MSKVLALTTVLTRGRSRNVERLVPMRRGPFHRRRFLLLRLLLPLLTLQAPHRVGVRFHRRRGIDKVQVTGDREHLLIEDENSDGYGVRCNKCHAFLFAAVRERKYIHVSLGVLIDTPSRLPDHPIHVASKAPWYQITDSLPLYDVLP